MSVQDLAVIGAGPAGAAAARKAAAMGLEVTLVEREIFPRYKPCGGALSQSALSNLGFDLPHDLIEAEIRSLRVGFRSRMAEVRTDNKLAVTVNRGKFDHFLLEKAVDAGAQVITGCRAHGVRLHDGGVEIETEKGMVESRFLVMAEGSQGIIRREIFGQDNDHLMGLCVVAEVSTESPGAPPSHSPDTMEIDFGEVDMGYAWVFPHGHYYSVGLGGLGLIEEGPRQRIQRYLARQCFDPGVAIHGHTIPLGGMVGRTVAGPCLLCGDAAGLVDPFTGEGISYALRSGKMASEAVAAYMEGVGDLMDYHRRLRHEIGKEIGWASILARTMHRFPHHLFSLFMEYPDMLREYLQIPLHHSTYRSFVSWLLPRLPGRMLQLKARKIISPRD